MVVQSALAHFSVAARLMAECLGSDGRICYAGAESSTLMANADGVVLPGTFGTALDRILLRRAGGIPTGAIMPGETEDDAEEGARTAKADGLGAGDLVMEVTASGSTPYPTALARAPTANGAKVVAVACNRGRRSSLSGMSWAACLRRPT